MLYCLVQGRICYALLKVSYWWSLLDLFGGFFWWRFLMLLGCFHFPLLESLFCLGFIFSLYFFLLQFVSLCVLRSLLCFVFIVLYSDHYSLFIYSMKRWKVLYHFFFFIKIFCSYRLTHIYSSWVFSFSFSLCVCVRGLGTCHFPLFLSFPQ